MNLNSVVYRYVKIRGRFYPLIPITVHGLKNSIHTYALINSSSIISLFPKAIAEVSGVDLSYAEEVYLPSVDGYVKTKIATIQITIEHANFSAKIPVAFVEHMESSLPIIGRQGFFKHFEIVFRDQKHELELRSLRSR